MAGPGPTLCTWSQQDDGGDDQRADDQNDKEGDRYSLPVPLRRVTAHQLLHREGTRDVVSDNKGREIL